MGCGLCVLFWVRLMDQLGLIELRNKIKQMCELRTIYCLVYYCLFLGNKNEIISVMIFRSPGIYTSLSAPIMTLTHTINSIVSTLRSLDYFRIWIQFPSFWLLECNSVFRGNFKHVSLVHVADCAWKKIIRRATGDTCRSHRQQSLSLYRIEMPYATDKGEQSNW